MEKNTFVFTVPEKTISLSEVEEQIPDCATVLDASHCPNFESLDGLEKHPQIRALVLANTLVSKGTIEKHLNQIEYLDLRHCPEIRSYSFLRDAPNLFLRTAFTGMRSLSTIPDNVNTDLTAIVGFRVRPCTCKNHVPPTPFNYKDITHKYE